MIIKMRRSGWFDSVINVHFSSNFDFQWLFWKKFGDFCGFSAISLNFLLAFSKSQQFRPIFSRGTKYRNSGKNYVWKTVFGEIFWHFNFYPVLQFFPEIQVRLIPDLQKKTCQNNYSWSNSQKNFLSHQILKNFGF